MVLLANSPDANNKPTTDDDTVKIEYVIYYSKSTARSHSIPCFGLSSLDYVNLITSFDCQTENRAFCVLRQDLIFRMPRDSYGTVYRGNREKELPVCFLLGLLFLRQ